MATIATDTEALWAALDATPDDLGILLALSDEYLQQGDDDVAECLQWAYDKKRKPFVGHNGKYEWFPGSSYMGVHRLAYALIVTNKDKWLRGSPTVSDAYKFLINGWRIASPQDREACKMIVVG